MKNTVVFIITFTFFVLCLIVVIPAKSGENHFLRLKTRRQHSSALALRDADSKGMVIGIDAAHLLRLMEMDPNLYVLYIGGGTEFERRFGGSKNAVHISLKQIKENTLKFPKNRTLILICPSGQQSPVAARIISARGFVVYYLIGGMKALNKFEDSKPMLLKEKPDQENGKKNIRQKKDEQRHPESIFEEEDMGC
jgi:rhodanese-related sulfurtransferase